MKRERKGKQSSIQALYPWHFSFLLFETSLTFFSSSCSFHFEGISSFSALKHLVRMEKAKTKFSLLSRKSIFVTKTPYDKRKAHCGVSLDLLVRHPFRIVNVIISAILITLRTSLESICVFARFGTNFWEMIIDWIVFTVEGKGFFEVFNHHLDELF